MTKLLDSMTRVPPELEIPPDLDRAVYTMAEIRAKSTRVIELIPKCAVLAVLIDPDEVHVSFAVFEFASGPCFMPDGKTTVDGLVDETQMTVLFHGEGPSSALRELRHTYWGEDGYIFYVHADTVIAALNALREWFDLR